MIYAETEAFLRELFDGKFRKNGDPVSWHSIRVGRMALAFGMPEYVVQAAYLHDVLEDTSLTRLNLYVRGYSNKTLDLVEKLTKPDNKSYALYLNDLIADEDVWVARIKLLDNIDNTDLCRSKDLTLRDINYFQTRYDGVRDRLVGACNAA